MKPLFGTTILIVMLFFNEIETSSNLLKKIKTRNTGKTAKPDDERRREDDRTTLIIGTPARQKKTPALRRWEGFEFGKSYDKTGVKAYKLFVGHYKEKGIPNAPNTTLTLYEERHAGGSYHLPEEQGRPITNRIEETREKTLRAPLVKQEHQQLYHQLQDFQDHSRGSGSKSRGADHRYKNQYNVGDQSEGFGSSSKRKFKGKAPSQNAQMLNSINRNAPNMFVDQVREIGLPNVPNATFQSNTPRHAGGSYYLPEEQGDSITRRFEETRKSSSESLVPQLYQQYQDFQDHYGGSRSSSEKKFREKGLNKSVQMLNLIDQNASNMFADHVREIGLPNTPNANLQSNTPRHAGGSHYLPQEQGDSITRRFEEARRRSSEPLVQQPHQQTYQQHQDFQDHYGGSGSSSRGADYRHQNQYNIEDQSGGSGSGSGYNHPYTAPPMTPSDNFYAHLDIQTPKHLDFEKNYSQNDPSATALIDNYNIHLRRKYGGHSKGSDSG